MPAITFDKSLVHLPAAAWKAASLTVGTDPDEANYWRKLRVRIWQGRKVEFTGSDGLNVVSASVDLADVTGPADSEIMVVTSPTSGVVINSAKQQSTNLVFETLKGSDPQAQYLPGFEPSVEALTITGGTTSHTCPGAETRMVDPAPALSMKPVQEVGFDFDSLKLLSDLRSVAGVPLQITHVSPGQGDSRFIRVTPLEDAGFNLVAVLSCHAE